MSKITRVAPVFPVRNVTTALAHYRSLGFEVDAYSESDPNGPIYGFVKRDSVELHLSRFVELDPKANTSACYLYVEDADGLRAAWVAAGVGGRFTEAEDTAYELREFAHVYPFDGPRL